MSGEQTTFLAGSVTDAPAAQSTATETAPAVTTPQAATGQTVATPEVAKAAPAETTPSTSGQAEATKPAPVEVKVPEGVELDGGLLEAIKSGDPQKVVDAYAAADKQQRDAWDTQSKQWKSEVEADKELGGKNLPQTVAYMQKAAAKFASKELIQELDKLGLGNHPGLTRLLANVGKAMAEDTVAGTTAPTNGSGTPDYRSWYPGQNLNP